MSLGGMIALAIVVLVLCFGPARRWWQQRRARREWLERQQTWQAEYEAANPVGEPVIDLEVAEFRQWLSGLALPCVALTPDPARALGPVGCHLGVPAFLPPGETWPEDGDGVPMEFLVQIDFAALPPLPDYPASGVLLLFVGQTDSHGVDFDDPRASSIHARWFARPDEGRVATTQPPAPEPVSPFSSVAREVGVALAAGSLEAMEPDYSDWRIVQRLEGQLRRPGIERIEDIYNDEARMPPLRHHIGGHPVFVQQDVRYPGHCDDYDRVLLRLTSDDHVIWGDVGEANVLITPTDLRACNFSRLAFTWDCS
ncbi:DUF1963 domain-containing protein [Altererythrobacter sp. KTW20L]|uniref:YwqG family protein n=1 Tax=Altererythrobacter sp. KTW20L TaxID=2942210 RepID=UPI0020BE8A7B|nr:DUF1963 domain-containing protein [Altererythrobacter sp. KTW20L]MCL6251447.1 DUF1963 domain-containing protein [Altererythrobacter sp. KTW20L]